MTPEEQAPVRCAHFWRHPNLPDRGDGGEPIVCALDEGHDGWHGSRGGTQWVDGSEYDHVPAPEETVEMTEEPTFWNGEPTPARRVVITVGDQEKHPLYWAREFVGQKRSAVEVSYFDEPFYIDDEDGSGWRKVTVGKGSPRYTHRNLYPAGPPAPEPAGEAEERCEDCEILSAEHDAGFALCDRHACEFDGGVPAPSSETSGLTEAQSRYGVKQSAHDVFAMGEPEAQLDFALNQYRSAIAAEARAPLAAWWQEVYDEAKDALVEALTRAEDAERKLEEMREALTGALEVIEAYIPAKVQPFVVRDKWRTLTPPASNAQGDEE